jgi:hypothetical protein
MAYKDAKSYYKLIKDEFSDKDEKLSEFYEYFENTWFSLTNPDSTRYSFLCGVTVESLISKVIKNY